MVAYYCFVNFGWTPSQFAELSDRERLLVTLFVKKEVKDRKSR